MATGKLKLAYSAGQPTESDPAADLPGTLRRIAEDIESGAIPEAATAVVILDTTDGLAIFGAGENRRRDFAYFILAAAMQELLTPD